MSTLRESAQQALEALEEYAPQHGNPDDMDAAITALRAALAQEEQEPVAHCNYPHCQSASGCVGACAKANRPPRREWRSLSDEERDTAIRWAVDQEDTHFSRTLARAIEQALRSKNHE